jgi:hypothetical protein
MPMHTPTRKQSLAAALLTFTVSASSAADADLYLTCKPVALRLCRVSPDGRPSCRPWLNTMQSQAPEPKPIVITRVDGQWRIDRLGVKDAMRPVEETPETYTFRYTQEGTNGPASVFLSLHRVTGEMIEQWEPVPGGDEEVGQKSSCQPQSRMF